MNTQKAKPLHLFTHPDTTQEEKFLIFIHRSYEFAKVEDKTSGEQLEAAFKAFEKRMNAERKLRIITNPRIGDNAALKQLKRQLRG